MSNRLLRQMRKTKSPRSKTRSGRGSSPLSAEGSSGDIQVVETSTGPVLFVKANNKWYTTELTEVQSGGKQVKRRPPPAPL